MNLIFMRHGEATDNVRGLISDKDIYWSVLTDEGIKTVMESVNLLPNNIDAMYVSPFPRTIQTAYYVLKKYPHVNVYIDNRIREIFYGKYSHKKNNSELDETRKKQIAGDYFIRFGEYGDNKFDIENRLTKFLLYFCTSCTKIIQNTHIEGIQSYFFQKNPLFVRFVYNLFIFLMYNK